MAPLSCGEVRAALAGIGAGTGGPVPAGVWSTLLARGAVVGDPSAPRLTPVGRHVLAELTARRGRADPLSLDDLAGELARVVSDLDERAKTAEYFLAELGPVTPPEALPLLRPVAVLLANLHRGPSELAEGFRNVWGSVEVMGGDPRDRLLAAGLLYALGAEIDRIYSPLMATTNTVRARAGPAVPAVTVATILHLNPLPDGAPAVEPYLELRKGLLTEEGAAMAATLGRPPGEYLGRRQQLLAQLSPGPDPPLDARVAAGYLSVTAVSPGPDLARVAGLRDGLMARFPQPITPAAILAGIDWLEVPELLNWFEKAAEIARARKLAPTPPELSTLALALVLGLRPTDLAGIRDVRAPARVEELGRLVALASWVYGPLLGASRRPAGAVVA